MEVRMARDSDICSIRELFHELDRVSASQQPEHFCSGCYTDVYFADLIPDANSCILLCVTDDGVIGVAHLMIKETKGPSQLIPCRYAYLQRIVISKNQRGKGYGRALLEASKTWAISHGAEYLRLSVIPNNSCSISFYKSNGLAEQMITMECKLPL